MRCARVPGLWAGIVLLLCGAGAPAFAEDAAPPIGATQGPLLRSQTLTTDAGPSPYVLRLQYTGEAWDNASGGIHDGTTYIYNLDAQLRVNTAKAFGWTGGSFFVEGFYNNAHTLDRLVGSVQDVSAVDTGGVEAFRLYQAYYKQDLGSTNLLFGIYDLETEFGNTRPMDLFFNGAYAWTSTLDRSGLNGPSTYPYTALAFRVREMLTPEWSVQAAVLDGVPDSIKHPSDPVAVDFSRANGALAIGEVDYAPVRNTKILAGYWNYTGQFDALNETNPDGSQRETYGSNGGYIGGATRLYSQAGNRGLDGFANIGLADSRTNEVDRAVNFGLTYTGPLGSRPYDRVGLAMGVVGSSGPYKATQIAAGNRVTDYEKNIELTYRAPINDWLTLQPDVQYLTHPNFDATLKNDFVFGIHFEIGHFFNL